MTDSADRAATNRGASRAPYWDDVYRRKSATAVTWYQPTPEPSLEWIRSLELGADAAIIDVGGGASLLVDRLLDDGRTRLAVLDVAASALEHCRVRLGRRASAVSWILADVAQVEALGSFALWHDRAVFHFLTESDDRRRYVELAARSVVPGGRLVVATFATDGPATCSGLPVMRYDAASLGAVLEPHFVVERSLRHMHTTPAGAVQPFTFLQLVRT